MTRTAPPAGDPRGFTLLELMLASGIMTIIGFLSFVVMSTSNQSMQLSGARTDVESGLRSVMQSISDELQTAYSNRLEDTAYLPEDTEPVVVGADGESITFQRPDPDSPPHQQSSTSPITYRFEYEDLNGNARLDAGEDTNGDGVLTRRLVREQDGNVTVVGAANTLTSVQFQLVEDPNPLRDDATILRIALEATAHYGSGDENIVRGEMESMLHLVN